MNIQKDCPFCHTKKEQMFVEKGATKHRPDYFTVICPCCECIGPTHSKKEGAIMEWNQR